MFICFNVLLFVLFQLICYAGNCFRKGQVSTLLVFTCLCILQAELKTVKDHRHFIFTLTVMDAVKESF